LTEASKGDSKRDESFNIPTSDGKTVKVDLEFSYKFDASRVSETFIMFKGMSGESVKETFIKPKIVAWTQEISANYPVTVLLETMAGKGSEIGGTFQELRWILDAVGRDDLGICLDTCHVYDGGYDIVNDLDGVLAEFDSVIGLDRLKALHLNDSKNSFGSHKDRHACLGEGSLGLNTFAEIVNHPALKNLPMILETPNELPGYQAEIALLRGFERE
jgi:apurinic endonuclease APN1